MSFSSVSTATDIGSPKHRLYKTKLCKHFLRGNCLYGFNCGFSHGEDPHFGLPEPSNFNIFNHLPIYIPEDEFAYSRRTLVDEVMMFGLAEPYYMQPAELRRLTEHW